MKLWHILTAVLFLSYAPSAVAADATGAGLRLCSNFIEDAESQSHSEVDFYFSWAQGFMSGLNIARLNDEPNRFKSMSVEDQKSHIRNFCMQNPTAKYFRAVIDLYVSLYPKVDMNNLNNVELNK
jgi:hypothetical protein